MRTVFICCISGLLVVFAVACPNPSTTAAPYVSDAAPPDAGQIANVCTHLVNDVKCADITIPVCIAGVTNLFASQEGAPPDLRCLAGANTKVLVRACQPNEAGPWEPCP